jgi:hypothetical protein
VQVGDSNPTHSITLMEISAWVILKILQMQF